MPPKSVIHKGIVLTMAAGSEPKQLDVYIEGDTIVALGDHGQPFPNHEADNLIDASECIIMPGLINIHTHTPMTIMRGTIDGIGFPGPETPPTLPPDQDWRGLMSTEDHAISTRLALVEMIHSGISTFVDMYHDMDRVAQEVIDSGIRAALGWEIIDFQNDPDEWLPYDEGTAKRTFEASVAFASEWNNAADGRVMTMIAPHGTSTCREPWLSRAAEAAHELGVGITMHVAESPREVEYCQEQHGITPVELLYETGIMELRVIGAHSIYLTQTDIELLWGTKYTSAACLRSYMKMATAITPVPSLLDEGINVGLGTDSTLTNNNLSLWNEIYQNATLHGLLANDPRIVSAEEALRMATVGGARALGMEDQIGTLEVGKKADLIIIDASQPNFHPLEGVLVSNLVYAAGAFQVRDMMVDGEIIMRDGKIETIDEPDTIRVADKTVRRLRNQVGLPQQYVRPDVEVISPTLKSRI
jgi:5-methylthioadenosine/S-adenosylhomocysteine deaminase